MYFGFEDFHINCSYGIFEVRLDGAIYHLCSQVALERSCFIASFDLELILSVKHELADHAWEALILGAGGGCAQCKEGVAVEEVVYVLAIQVIVHSQVVGQGVFILWNQEDTDV